MTPTGRASRIKVLSRHVGLDRIAIARAEVLTAHLDYTEWLRRGYAGEMRYLSEYQALRRDPRKLLPGAQSVITAALSYNRPAHEDDPAHAQAEPSGRVARYARGKDYHRVVRKRLEALIAAMRTDLAEPFSFRICVDTSPVLEKPLAALAGLGWIGKNTLILHPRLGSYLYLGFVITTLDIAADQPLPDHCGTCTRCLDACPTQAFPAPRVLDSRRCISYLTIEKKGAIDPALHAGMGDWLFGCDICQEVCPFNAKAPLATDPEVRQTRLVPRLKLRELVVLGSGAHKRLTRDTAGARATRQRWERNARIVAKNKGLCEGPGRLHTVPRSAPIQDPFAPALSLDPPPCDAAADRRQDPSH